MTRPVRCLLLAALLLGPASAQAGGTGGAGLHHDITVFIDPPSRGLEVVDRIAIDGGGQVDFYLAADLVAGGFTVDGRQAEPKRAGERWRVELGPPGAHQLVFQYKGRLAPLAGGRRGVDAISAMAGPEGAFLPASAGWIPLIAGRRFTYRAAVEAPEPHKALVPGRLIEEGSAKGRYRAVFASQAPARGLVLMAGPYVVAERFKGPIRLRAYFHPEIAALGGEYLETAAGYLDLYEQWIGDYPFSAFHIVSAPLPVGLGYTGLTYIGARVLKLPFIRHSSLGHEVLHSWWGNGVYVDYAAGNWAEGLTTYMADYAYKAKRGPAKALEMRLGWLRDYAALPPARDRPVADFVAKTHDAQQIVGYNKVAFIFHMLRAELGKPAFDGAVRRLWQDWKFRAAGWEDLAGTFEAASGRDLGGFFEQWLYRAGAPRLKLDSADFEAAGDGFSISLALSQAAPAYALKVPVRVTTEQGTERFTFAFAGLRARRVFPTRWRPVALAVDPDFDIFRRLDAAEAPPILRDVTLDAATVTVVLAADRRTGAAARQLAARLLDTPPRFAGPGDGALRQAPLLVIGATAEVASFLAHSGRGEIPATLAGRGTARVWASRRGGEPLVVVAADGAPALEALLRPLPHYGGKGYLVFAASKAVDHGVWPARGGPLAVRFGE